MYQSSAVPPQLAALGRDIRWPGVTATALYSNSCTVNSARRFLFHHPDDAPLAGFDLPQSREREVAVNANCGAGLQKTTARCSSTPGSASRLGDGASAVVTGCGLGVGQSAERHVSALACSR